MAFGYVVIVIGVIAILVGFLPRSASPAIQGAGSRKSQVIAGLAMIVGGLVLVLVG